MLCSNQLSYVADVARIIRVQDFSVNPDARIFSRAIKRLDVKWEVSAPSPCGACLLIFQLQLRTRFHTRKSFSGFTCGRGRTRAEGEGPDSCTASQAPCWRSTRVYFGLAIQVGASQAGKGLTGSSDSSLDAGEHGASVTQRAGIQALDLVNPPKECPPVHALGLAYVLGRSG